MATKKNTAKSRGSASSKNPSPEKKIGASPRSSAPAKKATPKKAKAAKATPAKPPAKKAPAKPSVAAAKQPVAKQPAASKKIAAKAKGEKPASSAKSAKSAKSVAAKSAKFGASKSAGAKPAESVTAKPAKVVAAKPVATKSAAAKPDASKSAAAKPAKPAVAKSAAMKPAAKPVDAKTKPAAAKPPKASQDEAPASSGALTAGTRAPAFELADQTGTVVSSDSLAGKPYVLYFYPKDNTPGCTTEACDFRDNFARFEQTDVQVFGVSPDSSKSHAGFAQKFELPFTLLADADKSLVNAYGVWVKKLNYGREYMGVERSTFLVGADGNIKKVWRSVKVKGHVDQVLAEAAKL